MNSAFYRWECRGDSRRGRLRSAPRSRYGAFIFYQTKDQRPKEQRRFRSQLFDAPLSA
jgi:hypothetical protein